jgi:hypothetical protein
MKANPIGARRPWASSEFSSPSLAEHHHAETTLFHSQSLDRTNFNTLLENTPSLGVWPIKDATASGGPIIAWSSCLLWEARGEPILNVSKQNKLLPSDREQCIAAS